MTRINRILQVLFLFIVIVLSPYLVSAQTTINTQKTKVTGYVHRFVGAMTVQPAGQVSPRYAKPTSGLNSFISGTDFEFAVYVQWQPVGHPIVDPNGLEYMQLDITGQTLNGAVQNKIIAVHDFSNAALPHPAWWTIGARIDTTNFVTGSVITLRATGTSVNPNFIETPTTWRFTVNNSLFMTGCRDLSVHAQLAYYDSAKSMRSPLQSPYLVPTGVDYAELSVNPGVDRAKILSLLPNYTSFITITHGNENLIGDVNVLPVFSPNSDIYSSDVEKAVNSKDVSQPPYSFAYFNSCNVFGDIPNGHNEDDYMAGAFLEGDILGKLPSSHSPDCDRAALGFQYTVYIDSKLADFDGLFIRDMVYHYRTLQQAVNFAYKEAKPLVLAGGTEAKPVYGHSKPLIEGDSTMTLRGVYGNNNNNGVTNTWHLQTVDEIYSGPK